MIRSTFLFLDKIGKKTEQNLWEQGIKNWDIFLNTNKIYGISEHKKKYYDHRILNARKNLYNSNSAYFCNILPTSEHWRLYEFFREECCFLDIETSKINGYLTVIGLFDGIETKTMIEGINFDYEALKKELEKYKLLVSFNGLTFDQPFLNKYYPNLLPKIPHFDLKHVCQRIGLSGGLKQVEKKLGIKRKNQVVEKMYNGDPIRLWKMFRATGDNYYLNLLVEYNEEDIVNLKTIADYVYEKLKLTQF